MAKVFDDEIVARAFRDASEALRRGDPDTLAGRFVPPPRRPERSDGAGQPPPSRKRVPAG